MSIPVPLSICLTVDPNHMVRSGSIYHIPLSAREAEFPGPVVGSTLPQQGMRVRSLVRELKSHMLLGMAKTLKNNNSKMHLSAQEKKTDPTGAGWGQELISEGGVS